MPRSTGSFISYDLRPAKQSERRILTDILKVGADCGLPISQYRYVGMGANRFYDFLLLHRYLGIADMVSLEHDPKMFERAKFNVPYGFVDVRCQTTADFLARDNCERPSIYWFDYDGGIGPHIVRDIVSLGANLKVGDLAFVTTFGGAPRVINRSTDQEKLAWIQDTLAEYAGEVSIDDVERSTFPSAVHKVLVAAFRSAFAPRKDGELLFLLQVQYSDSTDMITVGGGFLTKGQAADYKRGVKALLPFLKISDLKLYEIQSLHLTDRERVIFDRLVTAKRRNRSDISILHSMGFDDSEIGAYKDLLRYLPRYFESII